MAKCQGKVYKPILRWTTENQEKYVEEGQTLSMSLEMALKAYPTSAGQNEVNVADATTKPTWKLKCGQGDADKSKAHWPNGQATHEKDGLSNTFTITGAAKAAEVYTVRVDEAEVSTASKPSHKGNASNPDPWQKVTVFKLEHLTAVDSPRNKTRTRIGIGEKVDCKITPAGITPPPKWTATGEGSVNRDGGDKTVFTANRPHSNSTATVTVNFGSVEESVTFNILVPTRDTYWKLADAPCSSWKSGSDMIGARAIFGFLMHPTDVSFYFVHFREHIRCTWSWPDKSTNSNNADNLYDVEKTNVGIDESRDGLRDKNKLRDANTQQYVDYAFQIPIELQFKDTKNEWHTFDSSDTHRSEYRASDFRGRVIAKDLNESPSRWMGPWAKP